MIHTDPAVRRALAWVFLAIGLNQGIAPLVLRGLFDRSQRYTPALCLDAPAWWIACVAMTVACAAFAVLVHPNGAPVTTPGDRAATRTDDPEDHPTDSAGSASRESVLDGVAAVVFLAGLYNGIGPFVAKFVLDGGLLFALPARLASPWWWIVSIAVLAGTMAALVAIDKAKTRSVR